jgi:hypothetical protein
MKRRAPYPRVRVVLSLAAFTVGEVAAIRTRREGEGERFDWAKGSLRAAASAMRRNNRKRKAWIVMIQEKERKEIPKECTGDKLIRPGVGA